MRALLAVAMLAGCGRIGFDAASVVGTDAIGDIAAVGCDSAPGSYQFVVGTSRYRIAGTDQWLNSENDCEEGAGTHLVTVDSQTELDALRPLAGTARTWIGISDRKAEGTFRSVTGEVAAFVPWSSGAPVAGGEDCVSWDPNTGKFSDESCQLGRNRICECDGRDPDFAAY